MNITQMLKGLHERRGQQVKSAQTITSAALSEKRDLTADEMTKIEGIQKEIENVDRQIGIAIRQASIETQKGIVLSEGEQRDVARFDFGRVVRHLHAHARGAVVGQLDGVEAELISEGTREARAAGIEAGGIILPRMLVRRGGLDMERRDMTTTAGEGGHTIATAKAGLLDDFFNALILRSAGATVFENLVGNLDIPRILAGTAGAAKAETATADETSPTTAMLSLIPNRLPAFTEISEKLLAQSSENIQLAVSRVLTSQALATAERAFFHGSGTNEAEGICVTSGVDTTTVAGGTNGLAPAWSHIVGLETAVDLQNALLGRTAYLSNGKVRGKLKQTSRVSGQNGFILEGGQMNGYNAFFSNAVRSDLTKGSASGVCSAIVFGNAADYVMGFWGGVALEVIRDSTNAKAGLYHLQATLWYDGGVQRPKSFAAMLDALTT